MARNADTLLQLGDRQLRDGELDSAAETFARCADMVLAESLIARACELVASDPVAALRDLSQAERLVGATPEGCALATQAYESLGQDEIAGRFRKATRRLAASQLVAAASS